MATAKKQPAKPKAPKDTPVYSPNRSYTGVTAGIEFTDGNGTIPGDHPNYHHLVGWFEDHGYNIGTQPSE